MQNTSLLLMIEPKGFSYNCETAVNNAFQVNPENHTDLQPAALKEFTDFVYMLRSNDVEVFVYNAPENVVTPDALFPNNWISFHEEGKIYLYPMYAENRRLERNSLLLDEIKKRFSIKKITDLSHFETKGKFLEGTGSMVLDRVNRIAYACLSERTHYDLLEIFCKDMEYAPVIFNAYDQNGCNIYHTNVMLCIAEEYAVICMDSVKDENERKYLIEIITDSGKEIVSISMDQMTNFAGNMLQVKNRKGEKLLIMSTRAFNSLEKQQVITLEKYNRILHTDLHYIETAGGGSARCMLAEIFQ